MQTEQDLRILDEPTPESSIYLLFGDINNESVADASGWLLQANFEKKKPKQLTLLINSPGGDLHAAFAFIELMRGSSIPVHTVALYHRHHLGTDVAFRVDKTGTRYGNVEQEDPYNGVLDETHLLRRSDVYLV